MLDRIRLQNFKTHRDTEITLGRLTVLVGPNGAGKSSVLQAIALISGLPGLQLQPFKMLPRTEESVGPCALHLAVRSSDGTSWSYASDHRHQSFTPTEWQTRVKDLTTAMLRPDPARMAAPVPVVEVAPRLASDGSGLADVVATMRDADEQSFQALQSALRAVVPQIDRIGVRRIKTKTSLAHELTFDVAGRKGVPAHMMSGGTLLALAILALLHSPQRPRILLLDDLDHGLHPRAQWDLLKQLRRLLEQFPDLQIVATSHSPDLVDELDPSEVIVLALRDDGTSAAKPLTACPREDMLGVLRAGQLWSAVGEDWVKTGTTAEPSA